MVVPSGARPASGGATAAAKAVVAVSARPRPPVALTALGALNLLAGAAGLIILAFLAARLYRRPGLLRDKGRSPSLHPATAGTVLLLFFVAAPLVAQGIAGRTVDTPPAPTSPIAPADSPQVDAAMPESVGEAAALFWRGYLYVAPVIVLWVVLKTLGERRLPSTPVWRRSPFIETAPSFRAPVAWPVAVGHGFVGFVLTWPVVQSVAFGVAALHYLIQGHTLNPVAHDTLEVLSRASFSDPAVWALLLAVVFVGPLVEEVVHRGTIQAGLRYFSPSPWLPILATSLIFTLMHRSIAEATALPSLFVLSVGLGIAYEWTDRIVVPVVMHALFNLTNLAMLFALRPHL